MFYSLSFKRDDIGDIEVLISKYSKEPRYNVKKICDMAGVQNIKSFLLSINYVNGGLSFKSNADGSCIAWATKSALINIFEELKKEEYAPIILDILIEWFKKEIFPCAEKEAKNSKNKGVKKNG